MHDVVRMPHRNLTAAGGMGGPRCCAAANWESRLPGGAFPLRPN